MCNSSELQEFVELQAISEQMRKERARIWESKHFKWFFPEWRKKRIELEVWKQYQYAITPIVHAAMAKILEENIVQTTDQLIEQEAKD